MRRLAAALAMATLIAGSAEAGPAQYAQAHERIDIGGRALNLFCLGRGSPIVVFDSDAGSAGWDWLQVQPTIARKTRACIYDRAGLGFSDPSPKPGTSADAVDDLHALLTAAGLKPPFVLVGQGYGGMNVQLYAYTYPAEVVGLVIVDAPHEDEVARLDLLTGGRFSQAAAGNVAFVQDCAAAAQAGFVPGSESFTQCTGSQLRGRSAYGPVLSKAVLQTVGTAKHWTANAAEESGLPQSADQLRAARKSFGALKLISLTRGVSPYLTPGQPPSATNRAIEASVKAMHDEIAALSTRGSDRVVPGAGHDIQLDRPKAVIEAIETVLSPP